MAFHTSMMHCLLNGCTCMHGVLEHFCVVFHSQILGMATSKALGDQLLTISSLAETMTDQPTKDRMIESCMESARKQISRLRLTDSAEVQTLFATVQSLNFSNSQKDELMQQIGDRFVACRTPKSQASKKCMQTMDDPGCFLRVSDVTFISDPNHTIKAKANRMAMVFCSINCSCPTEPTSGRAVGVLKNDFGLKELDDPQVFYNTVQDFKASLKSQFKSNPSGSTTHVHNFTTPADLPSDVYARAYAEEGPSGDAGLGGPIGPVRKSSTMLKSQNNQKVPTLDLAVPSPNNMANMMMQGFQSMQHMFNVFANAQQHGTSSQANIVMNNNTTTNPPKQTLALTNAPDAASSPARAEPEKTQTPLTPEEQVSNMLSSWKNRQEENKKRGEDGDPEGGSENVEPKGKAKPKSKAKAKAKGMCKAKAKAKATTKPMVKAKAKAKTKSKAKAAPKSKSVKKVPDWDERVRMRPSGCAKCRWKRGCCPSCFLK